MKSNTVFTTANQVTFFFFDDDLVNVANENS